MFTATDTRQSLARFFNHCILGFKPSSVTLTLRYHCRTFNCSLAFSSYICMYNCACIFLGMFEAQCIVHALFKTQTLFFSRLEIKLIDCSGQHGRVVRTPELWSTWSPFGKKKEERHFTTLSPALRSWQAILNFSHISINFKADSNIFATPEACRGNCLFYLLAPPSLSCKSRR